MPKGTLLKRWNDWSAGVGHLVDDGRTPGLYYASGLLGLRGELRPAPFIYTATGNGNAIAGFTLSGSTVFAIATIAIQPASGATVVHFGANSSDGVTNDTSLTFSHTVSTGSSDLCLIVAVSVTGGTAPSGVTYDGNAMTQIGSISQSTDVNLTLWRLLGASVTEGTNNVVVSIAAAQDITAGAANFRNVNQSTPVGTFYSHASAATTDPAVEVTEDPEDGSVIFCSIAHQAVTSTPGDGQLSIWFATQNSTISQRATVFSNPGKFSNKTYNFQYFFEEPETADSTNPFLYLVRGDVNGDLGVYASKVSLDRGDFGTIQAGHHEIAAPSAAKRYAGQPARYQGLWYFPAGNDQTFRELTTVGSGAISGDTLTAAGASFAPGADHLANLGSQLVSAVQDGTNGGGARILAIDGAPRTAANWGSVFQVGDKSERPAGLRSLQGASFVLNREGLFSFNSKGRSWLVFEDLRSWPSTFKNGVLIPRSGGMMFTHPSGLLLFYPGEQPQGVGIDSQSIGQSIPASGVTEIGSGFHVGTVVTGDYTWSLYQSDPTSATALILVSYGDNPIVWQSLGVVSIPDVLDMTGCTVSLTGEQVSSTLATPTLWFGDGSDLRYLVLGPRASPFRSRTDTHKVNVLADAYMSELRFTEPVDLTELVVHTSKDMGSGDEFQISLLVNGTGDDIDVGPPVRGSGIRHVRSIDRKKGGKNVTSLVLHVNWVATSTANRVPPVIQSIELYGKPSVGGEEE